MARTKKAPIGRGTKARRPEPLTLEPDAITSRVRRALHSAHVNAERLQALGSGLSEALDGVLVTDAPERIRVAAVVLRASAWAAVETAARAWADAERIDALAELEQAADLRD